MGFSSFGGSLRHSQWTGQSLRAAAYHTDAWLLVPNSLNPSTPLSITQKPLPYPNPFSLSRPMPNQSAIGTVIGFKTQRAVQGNIALHMYDMFGNRIMQHDFTPEDALNRHSRRISDGTRFTSLKLTTALIGYRPPIGVYLFYVYAENQLIGQGKLMIVP